MTSRLPDGPVQCPDRWRPGRLLSPQQEVLDTLLRRDVPILDDAIIPWMESNRDQLATIVDLQLSMQSNRL